VYEDDFADNFVWYEWGFVEPSDLPSDESAHTDTEAGRSIYFRVSDASDNDRPWMT
jgi:hypothetical protein